MVILNSPNGRETAKSGNPEGRLSHYAKRDEIGGKGLRAEHMMAIDPDSL